jgi:hypothetical protein
MLGRPGSTGSSGKDGLAGSHAGMPPAVSAGCQQEPHGFSCSPNTTAFAFRLRMICMENKRPNGSYQWATDSTVPGLLDPKRGFIPA